MRGSAMRVALVIERFEPDGGGMEAVAWRVAHGLAEAGDEVHVVARRAQESRAVRLHRVGGGRAWQPLRVWRFARQAARTAPRGEYDVVHAFSRTRHQDLYRAGGGSHADYLERVHGGAAGRLRRLSPRHATLLAMERRIFGDESQTILCGSRLVRREIATRFGVPERRLPVLYNGVDADHFRPGERRAPDRPPVWLFAGSGFRRKGLDTALAALAASGGDARLLVAGRDPTRSWERLAGRLGIAERVAFLGPCPDMAARYGEADGLLLPTRYDPFANVCLEAAACGLPVVTSGANGCAELLADAGCIVADPEDRAGFAAALVRLGDPDLRARLGARGRDVASRHPWSRHVDELRRLYRELPR